LNPEYEHNNIQEANMFLAEDRVLCLLLYCNGYYLKYISDAYAYVDPCPSIYILLMQRRRWINGSWFALNYVVDSFRPKLNESNHDCWSKLLFYLSLIFAKFA
jgi:chitin synthase